MGTIRDEQPLRVLVIASTYPARAGDGTPAFVADLASFTSRTCTTRVLVPRVGGASQRERRGDLRIRRFPYFFRRWEHVAEGAILENVRARPWLVLQVPGLFLAEAAALRRTIRDFNPDVMHVHWIVPQGIVALFAARQIPWVLTTLGGDVYALRGRVWRGLKRAVLRHAYAVTTMNEDMHDRLLALGSPAERTWVVPMPADLDAVRRSGSGVDRVPGRILFAGRLVEKKGLAVSLDAMRLLPPDLGWSLDVIGDGPLRPALEPAADGLPVTLLEAMGAGCAIVASRMPGIDEAVADGISGVLTRPGDASELANAIEELLRDPDRRRRLGEEAARRAEDFSMDAIGSRFVALLHDAATRARGGWRS